MDTNTNLHQGIEYKSNRGEVFLLDAEGNLILEVEQAKPVQQPAQRQTPPRYNGIQHRPHFEKNQVYPVKDLGLNVLALFLEAMTFSLGILNALVALFVEILRMFNRTREYNTQQSTGGHVPAKQKQTPNVNVNVKVVIK